MKTAIQQAIFNNKTSIKSLRTATLASALVLGVSSNVLAQGEIEEVLVTAQKRDQNLQEVPIAMQVVDDKFIDDLAADNISDISQFIPGLDVGAGSPTQPRYTIRGIQTSDFGVGTDPAVGVYVDGVYSARSGAAVLSIGDIERIEVLKGPQGTLFGRNSAAGAVSVVTKKPTGEFEGSAGIRLGNFGKKRIEGMLNVPLSDSFALRVNGLLNRRDGLYTDAETGDELSTQDNIAGRAALRWSISDRTDATLTWTHDELDQDARPAIGIVNIPTAPATPGLPVDPSSYLDPFNVDVFNDVVDNHETRELDELALTVNHDINNMTLTSITSWRQFNTENREDEDGTNRIDTYFDTNNREENESVYQELRVAAETGAINWIAGTSYFTENATQVSDTFTFTDTVNTVLGNIGAGTPFTDLEYGLLVPFGIPNTLLGHGWQESVFNEGKFSAFAVYADAIWAMNDRTNLTLGGRYTKDEKEFTWLNGARVAPELDATLQALDDLGVLGLAGASPADFQFDFVFDQSPLAGVSCDNGVNVSEGVPCTLDRSWSDFSPRAVIDYKFTDNIMGYASYAKGYKAGGFNSVEIGSEFDNEDITNIEIGVKSEFPQQNLVLNVSGFNYEYNDKQAIRLRIPDGGTIPQYQVETSDDEAWGLDLQSVWTPTEPLKLFVNAQYIDATFKNRILADGTDLSGEPTGEPEWSSAFGARYETGFTNGSNLAAQVVHSYRGENRSNSESDTQGTTSTNTAFETGGSQNRTDLRISWNSPDDRYELGMYANNVFDKRYVNGINNITASTLGTPFVSLSDPRYWGMDLKIRF